METRYRGWVPTVTGRLSFSHFGDLQRTRSVRRSDTKKRYLIAYQNRKTGDALIPTFIQRWFGVGGQAFFVCVAETIDVPDGTRIDDQGALSGKIFIIHQHERWQRLKRASIRDCFASLSNFDQTSDASIEQYFSKSYAALLQQCEAQCSFQSSFRLLRNGVADFMVDDKMRTCAEAPRYDGPTQDRLRFGLTHQAYSYLKDLGHHHKHHSPRNDTITDLHDITNGDDRAWRRKTLYGIYRRIITSMRRDEISQQISSVGLLAYAKAFKSIWLETYKDDEENREIPIFYDAPMRESIQAVELRMRFSMQQRSDQNSSFRTVLFSGVGLILSIAGIVKISDHSHIQQDAAPYLLKLASLLLQYPLQIFAPMFAFFYFWHIAWPRYLKPQRWHLLRTLQALSQPFDRHWSFALFWLLALLIFVAGVELIFRQS